jgi:hypothetical protein
VEVLPVVIQQSRVRLLPEILARVDDHRVVADTLAQGTDVRLEPVRRDRRRRPQSVGLVVQHEELALQQAHGIEERVYLVVYRDVGAVHGEPVGARHHLGLLDAPHRALVGAVAVRNEAELVALSAACSGENFGLLLLTS